MFIFLFVIKEGADHVQNSALAHNILTSDFRFQLVPRKLQTGNQDFQDLDNSVGVP